MNHKILRMLFCVFVIFGFTSCALGPVNGILFTSNDFPGEFNPKNDVPQTKRGTGCIHQVLGLAAWGSAGAGKIAIDSGIQRIAVIDHSTMSVLSIVYSRYCTTVIGN